MGLNLRKTWPWLMALAIGSATVLWTAWLGWQTSQRVEGLEVRVERLEGR